MHTFQFVAPGLSSHYTRNVNSLGLIQSSTMTDQTTSGLERQIGPFWGPYLDKSKSGLHRKHCKATPETCDFWDIWPEWQGDKVKEKTKTNRTLRKQVQKILYISTRVIQDLGIFWKPGPHLFGRLPSAHSLPHVELTQHLLSECFIWSISTTIVGAKLMCTSGGVQSGISPGLEDVRTRVWKGNLAAADVQHLLQHF